MISGAGYGEIISIMVKKRIFSKGILRIFRTPGNGKPQNRTKGGDEVRCYRDQQDKSPKLHGSTSALKVPSSIENCWARNEEQSDDVWLGKGSCEVCPGVED